ncbi:CAMK family protein kinase [Tritrichomonas foetus]|uniref:non-specific serine/threonine protein kinase n=1 Tax=Tritrichomonas foetus TaxID=1144522 RepID=A0A1J4KZE4_9EUKA|nr:CAMK family protein kinase [Tritrichomonas foetus]|eukprot:OHT16232.1 CAMK family protein kinase [Tritrichomonas foetus]
MNEIPHQYPGIPTIRDYEILGILGRGSFGTVFLGRHKMTQLRVAIKEIQRSNLTSEEAKTRLNREISLLKLLDHPFIAQLFDIIETESSIFCVMEYVEHGNLFEFINGHTSLDENSARKIFSQLVSALAYLHNRKYIAHRDLKAENILLDRYNNIRLIDFGLSNEFTKINPFLKTACGSPAYAAPEMIQGHPYTKAADIWSAGIVLYAMVSGRLPFDDNNVQTILQKVVYTEVVYPPNMSRSLIDLLKRLLTKDPAKRITISQIVQHPWFSIGEYSSILDYSFSMSDVIDKSIVEDMKNFGLDVSGLTQSLMLDEFNAITAVYRQLKKYKMTENLKELMNILDQKISSNGSFPSIKVGNCPNSNPYGPFNPYCPSFLHFNNCIKNNNSINFNYPNACNSSRVDGFNAFNGNFNMNSYGLNPNSNIKNHFRQIRRERKSVHDLNSAMNQYGGEILNKFNGSMMNNAHNGCGTVRRMSRPVVMKRSSKMRNISPPVSHSPPSTLMPS